MALRVVDFWTGPEDNQLQPELILETDLEYGDGRVYLDADAHQSGDTFDIYVRGVGFPDDDIHVPSYEQARFRMPLDVSYGMYRIRVHSDGDVDDFRLVVRENRFELDSLRSTATRLSHRLVWRRTVNTFVYQCGTFTGDEALCDRFRERLEGEINLEPVTIPEEGLSQYGRTTTGHYYDAPSLVYRYRSEADFERAKSLLKEFSQEVLRNHTGDGLSVENWLTYSGSSWVYERQ